MFLAIGPAGAMANFSLDICQRQPLADLSKIQVESMIQFFRHIRQQLLVENKTGKYLKYAIGEIVLVVVGILIALSINTWKEQRNNLEKEKYYLTSIKSSIQLSQSELNRVINDAQHISSSADTLFMLLAHKKYDQLHGVFLDSLLFSAGDYS